MQQTNPQTAIILKLAGDLDLAQRDRLEALREYVRLGDVAVVDVTDVAFADSTFLMWLVGLKGDARFGATQSGVRLVGPSPAFLRLLEITHLASQFEIARSTMEALRGLTPLHETSLCSDDRPFERFAS